MIIFQKIYFATVKLLEKKIVFNYRFFNDLNSNFEDFIKINQYFCLS